MSIPLTLQVQKEQRTTKLGEISSNLTLPGGDFSAANGDLLLLAHKGMAHIKTSINHETNMKLATAKVST